MKKTDTVFSTFTAFQQKFSQLANEPKTTKRWQILERYFSKGGVLSIANLPNGTDWPEIAYPTRLKLQKDLSKLFEQKKELEKRLGVWKGKKTEAELSDLTAKIKKFKEPTYWKHLQKYYTNADYRKDADSVKLPVHLVSHPRWKPMINMFVKDLDYRKQLTETVETSLVYAQDKRLAKLADQQKTFRIENSQKNMDQAQKKLAEVNLDIEMLQELENWAKK